MKLEMNKIYQGNTLTILKQMPSDSVDTIITSPPYWGLRDYGEQTKVIWDGDKNCKHNFKEKEFKQHFGRGDCQKSGKYSEQETIPDKTLKAGFCSKCNAWYGQLGLEPTLELFIQHILQITKELKRVLKPTGVLWWNHGDSYCGSQGHFDAKNPSAREGKLIPHQKEYSAKCLFLQNYRLIIKMIDDQGWILRNDIKWFKPNHMPSSVKDRFANSYEPVFMLVKNKKYWFDLDAVRVPHKENSLERIKHPLHCHNKSAIQPRPDGDMSQFCHPAGKNPGDVWEIPTQPLPEAHFAAFPEKLIEPMILSSCPEWICPKCGKARARISKKEYNKEGKITDNEKLNQDNNFASRKLGRASIKNVQTIGWTKCNCNVEFKSGIILDPFMGAGTVGMVAKKLRRNYIGIELNEDYIKIAEKRIKKTQRIDTLNSFLLK